jgi:nitrous oxide reductase
MGGTPPGIEEEDDMAQDHDPKAGVSRRVFFGTAAGAAVAGAAVAMGGARPAVAQQTGNDRTRARYRATEHVETFYRTNRYTRPQE